MLPYYPSIKSKILHSGQHYSDNMSKVFFDEMEIPMPDYYLNINNKSQGDMISSITRRISSTLKNEKIDKIVVFGDTNTTLGGSLASIKLNIPLIHVEAGVRSFIDTKEEINRIIIDNISNVLLCPSKVAVDNLKNEKIVNNVYMVGDVMFDSFLFYKDIAIKRSSVLNFLSQKGISNFILATVHRDENVENVENLANIFEAFNCISSKKLPIVIPLHPHTKKKLEHSLIKNSTIEIIEPASYFDIISLLSKSKIVLTDSGGLQKDSYYSKVPCVSLVNKTGWIETVKTGWNFLAGTETKSIINGFNKMLNAEPKNYIPYGDGKASKYILDIIEK